MSEKSDYFKTFCKVSSALGTTLKKEKLLDLIVQSAIDTMAGKAACLFFEDEQKENDIFVPIAQKGLSKSYLHAEPKEAKRASEEIMKKGYVAIHDATTDPRVKTHELKKKEGIASILVVPVIVKERVKGVLTLYTSKPRIFSEDEIHFLTALAEQGGMAIERARLVTADHTEHPDFYQHSPGVKRESGYKNNYGASVREIWPMPLRSKPFPCGSSTRINRSLS